MREGHGKPFLAQAPRGSRGGNPWSVAAEWRRVEGFRSGWAQICCCPYFVVGFPRTIGIAAPHVIC